ncbi:MAG: hypothetical protein KDA24_09285 [Deltaproteobacteria bacterium]|nr:hypothetical protein [Deltaproteobacteria bacterium]
MSLSSPRAPYLPALLLALLPLLLAPDCQQGWQDGDDRTGGSGTTDGSSGQGTADDDDDDDTGDETPPPALNCDGGELSEIELADIWGRPLPGFGATDDATATLGPLEADCAPQQWLQCGLSVSGDNTDTAGSTANIDNWDVGVGNYSGREVAYAFRAPADARISWELVDPQPTVANQDLFVLRGSDDSCVAAEVMERGFNDVSFLARAGETYFMVLDSFPGEGGPFEVFLDCGALNDSQAPAGPNAFEALAEQPDGPFSITYTAPDYLPTTVSGRIEGGRFEDVQVTGSARFATSWDDRILPGSDEACRVNTLYVGLDHAWFAASAPRPPREGNQIDMMMSGEQLFEEVYLDLSEAQDSAHIATWWWQSDFELYRPAGHPTMTEEERYPQTIMGLLEASTWLDTKVMVSRFCDDSCFGWVDWITVDGELIDKAEELGDGFEVALQGNPTDVPLFDDFEPTPIEWELVDRVAEQPQWASRSFSGLTEDGNAARIDAPIASYHQKMMTIDGSIAYVSGMNIKAGDWDTENHYVFEPRRMSFDSDLDDREDVVNQEDESDQGPRKDYGLRIEGPIVADVDSVLEQRWEQSISAGEPYTENNTVWTAPLPTNSNLGGTLEAQFQVTLPDPYPERSILESHIKAIRQAQEYIYVEDQYWRAPVLNEVIIEVLEARPQVKLVVVTMPVSTLDPSAHWTAIGDQMFKERVPDQYVTFTTKSFDWAIDEGWFFDDIDVFNPQHSLHSKIFIVDDRYLTIGSANKNNRGMLYEGEANVAVLDEAWVSEQRQRLLENLVGPDYAGRVTDDFSETWDLLKEVAEANETAARWWDSNAGDMEPADAYQAESQTWPSGFLYPLELPDGSLIDPGPDAFR